MSWNLSPSPTLATRGLPSWPTQHAPHTQHTPHTLHTQHTPGRAGPQSRAPLPPTATLRAAPRPGAAPASTVTPGHLQHSEDSASLTGKDTRTAPRREVAAGPSANARGTPRG